MDQTSSRIDRLTDKEKSELFANLKQGGISDGLLRKIAELPQLESGRVIKVVYATLIQEFNKPGSET